METTNINTNTNERTQMLKQIQAYNFAACDLGLYLNTHPYDKKTLEIHANVAAKLKETKAAYQSRFGPLTSADSNGTDEWQWNDDPWPWDAQNNTY